MKIAVDGYELHQRFTGVGRYLHHLLQALLKVDPEHDYTLFLREEPSFPLPPGNLKTVIIPFRHSHTRWQNTALIRALHREKFDLFFSPDHSIPLRYRGPSVMTIHDPSWKSQKGDYSIKERLIRDLKTRLSLRHVHRVFTVSRFSRREILTYYPLPAKRVVAIHSGVEDGFRRASPAQISSFRRKYGIERKRVIGFLGSMFRRRHIDCLLSAFNRIDHSGLRLFLVGENQFHRDSSVFNRPGVIRRERLEEGELNAFYSSLDLLVYISSYEGFGFPPMEALLCQTPSLLLKSSSLQEIYPGLAYFIDRPDPAIIHRKIEKILASSSSMPDSFRQNWEKKRPYFRWERAAREYLEYF